MRREEEGKGEVGEGVVALMFVFVITTVGTDSGLVLCGPTSNAT
jgi:hypothetical protein